MSFTFPDPQTTPEFTAENGITYAWDADDSKWQVKSNDTGLFVKKAGDDISGMLGWNNEKDGVNEDSYVGIRINETNKQGRAYIFYAETGGSFEKGKLLTDLEPTKDSSIVNRKYVDTCIDDMQKQIDELAGIIKGNVARYVVDNNNGTPVSRPGQLSSNNPFWSNVVTLSFGTQDADNVPTRPMETDDIIDIVDVTSSKSSRYKVTDASGAPTVVSVEYISGNADFSPNQEKQVYIY